jgi:hypothetical protein
MTDLRAFSRELMVDAARDLGTKLDWIAVDYWNTDNPHTHVLVRGRADDGRRQGQRVLLARDLLNALRGRELSDATGKIAVEIELVYRPSAEGEHIAGIYRQRVILSSGRFAMIVDGLGFQLVPWRPALEQLLGRQVSGVMLPSGGVDWSFGRKRGLGL